MIYSIRNIFELLNQNQINYWLDAGTFESLLEAGTLVKKLKNI